MTQVLSTLGVDLTSQSSTQDRTLGETFIGDDAQVWVYCKFASATTQYDWVGIDENFSARPLTNAMAQDGWQIGIAPLAYTINYYGWAAIKGANLTGRVGASCNADVSLYTSATAGVLDDTAGAGTSLTKIEGVVLVTANASASIRSKEVLVTSFPRATTF